MSSAVAFILSLSCTIPALTGLFKWRPAEKSYRPFLLMMVAAMLSELIVGIAKLKFNFPQLTPPVYNLYFLTEFVLYLVLYKNFQLVTRKFFFALLITGIILLALDFTFLEQGNSINVLWQTIPLYAEVVMSFIILLMAVKLLSVQVFIQEPFFKNPKNLIAVGTILLKAFTVLLFSFMALKMQGQPSLFAYSIFQFINPFCYLVFTWALLCIPNKKTYSVL